jgi:hypothetical protein
MKYWLSSIFMFIAVIGLFVGAAAWTRSLTFPDAKNSLQCSAQQDPKGGNCTIFQDDVCWKGKCGSTPCESDDTCSKKSHPGPLILMLIAVICFIVAIVLMVLNFTLHKQVIVRHEYGSSYGSLEY